jgi:FMN-dependent NADH-azoreductase
MSKVLFVNACVREQSRTLKLARFVLKKLGQEVDEVRVFDTALYPLDAQRMADRDAFCASKDFAHPMFDLGKQFKKAETIVVAAPYWDLMFPASLKSYLETITVNDLTFTYDEHGHPVSLCNGKKLIFVTTSGGPIHFNFGFDYLSAMAKTFFGIKDVKCIKAECLDIQGADVEGILAQVKESLLTTTL